MTTSFWFKRTPDVAKSSSPECHPSLTGEVRREGGGFSLVEITIAMGVFTFAILSVIGLLGVALNISEDTHRDSSLSSLIRTLNSEVRSATSTNAMNTLLSGPLYFDIVGKPVPQGTNAYFRVTFSHSNQNSSTRETVKNLLSLNSATNLNIWSATVAYPPPAHPLKTVVLINNATY